MFCVSDISQIKLPNIYIKNSLYQHKKMDTIQVSATEKTNFKRYEKNITLSNLSIYTK